MRLKTFAAFFLGMTFPAVLSAANLLENPSFETADEKGSPVKWKANKSEKTTGVEHKLDQSGTVDGRNAALIKNTSPQNGVNQFMAWIQGIDPARLEPYTPGKEMLFSFDFQTDMPATAIRAYVEGRLPGGKGFSLMGPTATRYVGWGRYSFRFRMPHEKPALIYVVLQLLNTGTVKFDNVCIDTAPSASAAEAPKAPAVEMREPAELRVTYDHFPPRRTFLVSELPGRLRAGARMGREKFSEVFIVLKDDNGRSLRRYRFDSRGNRIDGTIEIPKLKAGIYHLESSAFSLGKKLTDTDTFRVAETHGTAGVRFRKDHVMLLNGKPFFPLAVCPPFLSGEALEAYRAAGFNVITPQINASGSSRQTAYLYPLAAKYGLHIIEWVNFADQASQPAEDLGRRVREAVRNTRNIPNFLGWMNDEDAWRGISAESVKKVYDIFFRYAPDHILWCNQAPRGSVRLLAEYGRYCDVTGADVYPVPASVKHSEMPNQTIGCIGDYTDDFVESVRDAKPVWMILQAWSWGGKKGSPDKPFPNRDELRFMFYNAITHGATGIAWFDNNTMDPANPVFPDLAAVNLEFKALESFLTCGGKGNFAVPEGEEGGLRLMQRTLGNGKLLIAVNELDQPRKVTIRTSEAATWYFSPGNRSRGRVLKGAILLEMRALDVVILSTRPVENQVPETFPRMKPQTPVPLPEAVHGEMLRPAAWRAKWVWNSELMADKGYAETVARQSFSVKGSVKSAWLAVAADNIHELEINGKVLGGSPVFKFATTYDIAPFLREGENEILVKITNLGSYGGVLFEGEISSDTGKQALLSGENTFFRASDGAFTVKPYLFGAPPVGPWGEIMALPLH